MSNEYEHVARVYMSLPDQPRDSSVRYSDLSGLDFKFCTNAIGAGEQASRRSVISAGTFESVQDYVSGGVWCVTTTTRSSWTKHARVLQLQLKLYRLVVSAAEECSTHCHINGTSRGRARIPELIKRAPHNREMRRRSTANS